MPGCLFPAKYYPLDCARLPKTLGRGVACPHLAGNPLPAGFYFLHTSSESRGLIALICRPLTCYDVRLQGSCNLLNLGGDGIKIVTGVYSQPMQLKMHRSISAFNAPLGLLWLLGVSTGYRVSDLLILTPLNVREGILQITESKTGKHRATKLSPKVMTAISKHIKSHGLQPGDFLFFGRDRSRPITRQYAHRIMRLAGEQLGLTGIGTHSMRKTYAYNVLLQSRDLRGVQSLLGHTYMSTTLLYLVDGLLAHLPASRGKYIPPATVVLC